MRLSAVPESCPELLLSSTIYSHGEGPDSRRWELRQQPQHLPPSAVAAGRVSCPEKQLRGSDVVTAGGGIPISSSSGHTETRARPFGTWSQLVCGALRSCAGSLPLPAVPPGTSRLLPLPARIWVLLFPAPLCQGLEWNSLKSPLKARAGESQILISPSGSQAVTFPPFLGMWALLPSLGCHSGPRVPEQHRERPLGLAPHPAQEQLVRAVGDGRMDVQGGCNLC